MRMTEPLKLRGEDEADLRVIAACLQDALVAVGDMAFLPKEKRFVLLLNRFRWETNPVGTRPAPRPGDATFLADDGATRRPERTHCALRFDRVLSVQAKGIDPRRRGAILELLTIRPAAGSVELVFASDATLRLNVEAVRCYLEDVGEGWPTAWRPQHPLDDAGIASE